MAILGYDFTALTSTGTGATGVVFATAIASPGFVALSVKPTTLAGALTAVTPTASNVAIKEVGQGTYTLLFDAEAAGGDVVALLDSGSANGTNRYISVPLNRDRAATALPAAAPSTVGGLPTAPTTANSILPDNSFAVSGTITKAKLDRLELAERSGHYKAQYGVPTATQNTYDYYDPADTALATSLLTVVVTVDAQGRPTQAIRTIH